MSAKGDIVYIHRPQTPTIEGFCSYVGILRRTFADYTKTPDLGQACELIRERILAFKMGSLVNGRGHASGLIFDITNNHKGEYQHVSKVDNNNSGEVKIIIERERNAGIQNKNEGAARESMEGD